MSNCAIVGINWGDEGKGRMVDLVTADYAAFRAALEALFDTFASGGRLTQPNETVAYAGLPAAPRG